MSSEESSNRVSSVVSWFLVAALVLSSAALPVATGSAKAADAHLAIANVDVSPEDPAPGQQTTIETTITNGRNSPSIVEITDVYVRQPGSSDDIARVEDVGTVTVGGNISVPLSVSFEEPGTKKLRVIVTGKQANGSTVSVRYPLTVDVKEPERPQLEVSAEKAVPGATRSVNVTVANGLDRDLRQVRIVSSSPEVNFSANERVRAQLAAGNATTFRLPASVSEEGTHPVNLTLHYTDRGVQHCVTRTYSTNFAAPSNSGEIVLTDLQATQSGGTLEVSATAGNVGSSSVEGVVVSVANSSSVEQSKYFVGSIDESDFSSFTLRSDVEGNVSSVPVKVRYTVGGVERSFTTDVSVDRRAVRPQPSQEGGLPLLPIGGAAVLLVGAIVFFWRR
ncbi:COG1361 family protein [Halopelagius longus]|uniref:Uncharacterized conserved protein n=1 Tax=Halopelagius longus TaxID=1236180 RepID=A0A1H1G092_9EURY|nr:hypothetical protein [Halopelagius longus]RDI69919.1 hypothetical protein DWB78_17390 [Halopelagius longus]SDR06634.1 Uncharacterized conserved protein [Halopelagius longus]